MAKDGKITLNPAGRDELARIEGIGDECADIIVNYREENDGISIIDELADVPGFGQQAPKHLKEHATV